MDCNCAVLEGGRLAGHYYMSMLPEIQIDVLMNVGHIGDSWIYCFVIYESIIIIVVYFYIRVYWVASQGSNDQCVAVETHLSLMSRCTVTSCLFSPTGELI